jgi:hypothetical protein
MKLIRLLFFFFVVGVSFGLAQDCQMTAAVPANQVRLARGKVFLDNDGVATIKGGQAVYAKITNESDVEVSYWFAVAVSAHDKEPYAPNCKYAAVLAPKASAVLWGSSTAEAPIPWQVSVTKGPDSGDPNPGVLRYEVYSNPPKIDSNPPKKNAPKQ